MMRSFKIFNIFFVLLISVLSTSGQEVTTLQSQGFSGLPPAPGERLDGDCVEREGRPPLCYFMVIDVGINTDDGAIGRYLAVRTYSQAVQTCERYTGTLSNDMDSLQLDKVKEMLNAPSVKHTINESISQVWFMRMENPKNCYTLDLQGKVLNFAENCEDKLPFVCTLEIRSTTDETITPSLNPDVSTASPKIHSIVYNEFTFGDKQRDEAFLENQRLDENYERESSSLRKVLLISGLGATGLLAFTMIIFFACFRARVVKLQQQAFNNQGNNYGNKPRKEGMITGAIKKARSDIRTVMDRFRSSTRKPKAGELPTMKASEMSESISPVDQKISRDKPDKKDIAEGPMGLDLSKLETSVNITI